MRYLKSQEWLIARTGSNRSSDSWQSGRPNHLRTKHERKNMAQNFLINNLDLSDSYKDTQFPMYPDELELIYSYFESRGGIYEYCHLFGLQYIIKRYLTGVFITQEMLDEQVSLVLPEHFGPQFEANVAGWQYLIDNHGGKLPVEIRAIPEGLRVPTKTVMYSVHNTGGKRTAWVTNWLETVLQLTWYGSTVFTLSASVGDLIRASLIRTADPLEDGSYPTLPFSMHDFGFRGATSVESAGIGGAAHLCNFRGTDTKIAMSLLHQFYNAPRAVGKSVPASEHSVMEFATMYGQANETEVVSRILDRYPTGIVSIVGDTYNIYNFVDKVIGVDLKDRIIARHKTKFDRVVIRPDSGDPITVVLYILNSLARNFGFTINKKGFKVLSQCVGVIQGDGMTPASIKQLYDALEANGWSAENVLVGMGGGLLQRVNRDTQKFAQKGSAAILTDGTVIDLFKDPITDPGKQSKRGFFSVVFRDGEWKTIKREFNETVEDDVLRPVFRNGELLVDTRYETILESAKLHLNQKK